jgi:hypothetical protein
VDTRAIDQLRAEWIDQRRRSDGLRIGAILLLAALFWLGLRIEPLWIAVAFAAIGLGACIWGWLPRRRP